MDRKNQQLSWGKYHLTPASDDSIISLGKIFLCAQKKAAIKFAAYSLYTYHKNLIQPLVRPAQVLPVVPVVSTDRAVFPLVFQALADGAHAAP